VPTSTRVASSTGTTGPVVSSTPVRAASPPPGPTATRVSTLSCKPHSFPQRTQQSLAVDPTDDRKVYIGVEQEGFFRSEDGGETWTRAINGFKAWPRLEDPTLPCFEEFYSTIIDPTNPDRICVSLAGSPGLISLISSAGNNGVYCSEDGARTWTQRVGPTMNTAVYALVAHPRDFNIMYAGVNGGPCPPPPICQQSGTYFNTTGAIYRTTDGGKTWTELDALYSPDLRVNSLAIDEANPSVVVAGTFAKLARPGDPGRFDTPQIGVLRSTDGGGTWKASTAGMNEDPRERALLAMAIAPRNASRMFVTASSNQSYWSDDGGQTFHRTTRVATFAFDPHDSSGLHMIGVLGAGMGESVDGGKTWAAIGPTPGFVAFELGLPTDIEWSRLNRDVLYMAGPYATVFRSADSGRTWKQVLSAERLPR
jgi:photosystem II stability/assembly factor-like uncharacterized protein